MSSLVLSLDHVYFDDAVTVHRDKDIPPVDDGFLTSCSCEKKCTNVDMCECQEEAPEERDDDDQPKPKTFAYYQVLLCSMLFVMLPLSCENVPGSFEG